MRTLPAFKLTLVLPIALVLSIALALGACQPKGTPDSEQIDQNSEHNKNTVEVGTQSVDSVHKPLQKTGSMADNTYKPSAEPAVKKDPAIEKRIQALLQSMTLEQKIGQMIQVRIGDATLKEIEDFGIGSILNGGGQTPNDNADSTALDWANYADQMFQASIKKNTPSAGIPILWGTDAVHGHNNVKGAVLYPHNIALGATHNPELVKNIAEATALSIAATGIDWNFAPTVATARDYRWGRTYESFSEDPALVTLMGSKVIEGLQGKANSERFLDQYHVISTAKHFIGDGGTAFGDDQGYTYGRQDKLLRIHLPAYIAAIESGVQTIMASYNFWNGVNSHGNKALLTDLLKNQLKFDGIIVSDWQAIPHIEGCTLDSCAEAVNAGVDLFMIPKAPDWQNFHRNTAAQVKDGRIPISRINDAVSRILRVKMRAGLWDKPSPAKRAVAGKQEIIGSHKHRQLARQAVRESLVLLKNNGILPLNPKQTILIAGAGAHNLSMQSGGWSVTWQGKDNGNEKYLGATSIYDGIAASFQSAGGEVLLSENGDTEQHVDAAIVVFGEQAYAEMYGDIQNMQTLEFEQMNKKSLRIIKKLKSKNIPVVAVFLSGRPLWVNKELNLADAFVSAWLPGSEGQGLADVIIKKVDGSINHDFKGKLSFSWPNNACDASLNKGSFGYAPLYELGFGLTYKDPIKPWVTLNEDTNNWTYGCRLGNKIPNTETTYFHEADGWDFYIEKVNLTREKVNKPVALGPMSAHPDSSRKSAISVSWDGSEEGRLDLRNNNYRNDFLNSLASNSAVVFDIRIESLGQQPLQAVLYSSHLAGSTIDLNDLLAKQSKGEWQTLSIDLRCFTNIRADMNKVSIPFGLHSKGKHILSIANVRYEPSKGSSASINCLQ